MTNFFLTIVYLVTANFSYFISTNRRARPGAVQILCCRTPPRWLGISKCHFTGMIQVHWGWFMSIFINLSALGTSPWPLIIFGYFKVLNKRGITFNHFQVMWQQQQQQHCRQKQQQYCRRATFPEGFVPASFKIWIMS